MDKPGGKPERSEDRYVQFGGCCVCVTKESKNLDRPDLASLVEKPEDTPGSIPVKGKHEGRGRLTRWE